MKVELLGWLASLLFALSALPQALLCTEQMHAKGLSWLMLLMWFFGELLMMAYAALKSLWLPPLWFNYLSNFACLAVIIGWKLYGG